MRIPFLPQYALIWHYPVTLNLRERDPMRDMLMKMMQSQQGEDWSPKPDEVRYEKRTIVHWAPARAADDLPSDINVRDVQPNSVKPEPLMREYVKLSKQTLILHRQGHIWAVDEVVPNSRYFRGIVAAVTQRRSVAERWLSTGSIAGLPPVELPKEVLP